MGASHFPGVCSPPRPFISSRAKPWLRLSRRMTNRFERSLDCGPSIPWWSSSRPNVRRYISFSPAEWKAIQGGEAEQREGEKRRDLWPQPIEFSERAFLSRLHSLRVTYVCWRNYIGPWATYRRHIKCLPCHSIF